MFKVGDRVVVSWVNQPPRCGIISFVYKNCYGSVLSTKIINLYSVETYNGINLSLVNGKDLKLDVQYYRDQKLEGILK